MVRYISVFIHLLLCVFLSVVAGLAAGNAAPVTWSGQLRDARGKPLAGAHVECREVQSGRVSSSQTDSSGAFAFPDLAPGSYSISVRWQEGTATAAELLEVREGERVGFWLEIDTQGRLAIRRAADEGAPQGSGGERLSSQEVSGLPLNKRDFSQLLLLAAGTMTDANGAANFTQQFAVNGQRGSTTVFAMDGIDTTDPEMGGATFSNFNVDAIQEIDSSSGVLPAEIGHGAAGFTNIATKSGTSELHGSIFEFVRNAAFDARNFFDRRTVANPGRIPPFIRNEFGFTNGGPVVLPGLYNGRGRTFYFGQYQGFRQVLGTTQVISVPTLAERQGMNTTAFPGDTLLVPVDPRIAPVLERYPLPNDPQGPYGERTYATSSKVTTSTDQFSLRIDHRISDKATLFARFNLNQVDGPLTNPSQTAIDPDFAVRFLDHQRNFGLTYTRAVSPNFTSESSFGFIRSTPFFPTANQTQPALKFADGLYESFNSAAGSVIGSFGNLFQARQNFTYVRGSHTFKMGAEARFNKDATIFGTSPNGEYIFGGGTAYAPVAIPSASGLHDLQPGDPMPDALTGFLTATPHSYTVSAPSAFTALGDRFDEAAVRREAFNIYFQDAWKVSPRLVVNYGLRYEVNGRIHEAKHRTSASLFVGASGEIVRPEDPGARLEMIYYPQPAYGSDWRGWGPRVSVEWRAADRTVVRAGGAITTILPNLWQDNFLTGGIPFLFSPYVTALPGVPVPFENAVTTFELPPVYTPAGELLFATGRTTDVAPNTGMDIPRFQEDLAALTPGNQVQALFGFGISRDFRNGYIGSYTAGVEQELGDVKLSASYVATVGVKLAGVVFPNNYGGADPAFAPFTGFDTEGHVIGGYGPIYFMSNASHSTYHSLQTAVEKISARAGAGIQASYTFSKSLDDSSAALGGLFGSSGTVLQAFPQNPRNLRAEKGPSTFDVAHVFTLSLIQALPLERVAFLRPLGRKLTSGWQLLNITTLTSGPPFS
ncbi:MAG TPA: TonB-dependent receptor, partial [Terriglobia bacterium]|nr:TonB-dependent receptor [Terriglobia bacterium]